MRDKDTIETAITAAETGHLVFGTLHTGSASDAIDRMVQVFPEGMQNQIRLQLSMTLMAVISQQLVKKKTGGRVLASEVMVVTDGIRNMIRGGNTPQIANAIATSAAIGGQTMDQSLGNNGAESSGDQVRLNADILQTFDRSHSIVGMDCGKHNVSGDCGTHTDLGGLTVSNLSDGNDIRVLTKDGTKTIGKIHACFLIDLPQV